MQEKIESFGYKLWNTEKEWLGENLCVTNQYQKRVDEASGWLSAPLCKTNDKLFLNIKETKIALNGEVFHSWTVNICHENDNKQWCNLDIYGLKEEDLENMLTFENKLRKMWIAFN